MLYKQGQIIQIKSEKEIYKYKDLIDFPNRKGEANLIAKIICFLPAGYDGYDIKIGDYYKIEYIQNFPNNYEEWGLCLGRRCHDEIPGIIIKGLYNRQLDLNF